jgi:anti-sigma regulatory factor (Ser/Thr protein kinase)
VLYTDGLTEAQRTPIEGEARLRELISGNDPLHAVSPARWIRRAILDDSGPNDDVAILVISLHEGLQPASVRHWSLDVRDSIAAHAIRHEFALELHERGLSQQDVENAEVVLGELVGNTVRYAPGRIEIIGDWSGPAPVVHVLDRGPGFQHNAMLPADPYSESGRGLFIVSALTQDFRVHRREGGGSHARAVLVLTKHKFAVRRAHTAEKILAS